MGKPNTGTCTEARTRGSLLFFLFFLVTGKGLELFLLFFVVKVLASSSRHDGEGLCSKSKRCEAGWGSRQEGTEIDRKDRSRKEKGRERDRICGLR